MTKLRGRDRGIRKGVRKSWLKQDEAPTPPFSFSVSFLIFNRSSRSEIKYCNPARGIMAQRYYTSHLINFELAVSPNYIFSANIHSPLPAVIDNTHAIIYGRLVSIIYGTSG